MHEDRNAHESFEVEVNLQDGYKMAADPLLKGVSLILVDEPPPLGEGVGPNPARLLAMAVASCLSASALFCLRKARIEVHGLRTRARTTVGRNEEGRLRIEEMRVEVRPEVDRADLPRMDRCLELFEDFCIVTQSVRRGLRVTVRVDAEAPAAAAASGAEVS